MIAERKSSTLSELPLHLPRMPQPAPRLRGSEEYGIAERSRPQQRPMGERGSRVVRRARAFGWRSPMSAAVLVASFFVSLASLYVSAYARVTMQSVEKARLTRQIREAEQEEEGLHARISQLTIRSLVQARAMQMKMERNSSQSAELLSLPTGAGGSIAAGDGFAPTMTVAAAGLSIRKILP